jgi:hypothetical protein
MTYHSAEFFMLINTVKLDFDFGGVGVLGVAYGQT